MKSIEQVREEYMCPKEHDRENYTFANENVYCEKCKAHYDIGMMKYK